MKGCRYGLSLIGLVFAGIVFFGLYPRGLEAGDWKVTRIYNNLGISVGGGIDVGEMLPLAGVGMILALALFVITNSGFKEQKHISAMHGETAKASAAGFFGNAVKVALICAVVFALFMVLVLPNV